MNKAFWSKWVMVATIILLFVVQGVWLYRLFGEERTRTIQQADVLFKDLVYKLQLQRFKADTLVYNAIKGDNVFGLEQFNAVIKQNKKIESDTSNKNGSARKIFLSMFADSLLKGLRLEKNTTGDSKMVRVFIDSGSRSRINVSGIHIVSSNRDSFMRSIDTGGKAMGARIILRSPIERFNYDFKDSISEVRALQKSKNRFNTKKINSVVSMFTRAKTTADSISTKELDSAYTKELKRVGLNLQYQLASGKIDSLPLYKNSNDHLFQTNIATVGLINPSFYKAVFDNPNTVIIRRILPQAIFSIVLVLLVSLAFIFMYRNIVGAEKLSALKNDFISNITHELKTPVATVQVAVEALRNFDAIKNPEKTKDYLDIAALELQRLGLLVDKVLRISMFERAGFTLNKEVFDFKDLVEENIASLKLQFERTDAAISFEHGNEAYPIKGDKLHLLSVVYNLLDNALKYSKEKPVIAIKLSKPTKDIIRLDVQDNGIGIPHIFLNKVFDRFFRVPHDDLHNVKGYGLGLSYVQFIVKDHGGHIEVKSEQSVGTTFSVWLPQEI